jgi:hypothetical protein
MWVRRYLVEAEVCSAVVTVRGVVTRQEPQHHGPNRIHYRFSDGQGNEWQGKGEDRSDLLYEGMSLLVLYDRDRPSHNLPLVGLYYHEIVPTPISG